MVLNYSETESYINDLLRYAKKYGERMATESPFTNLEMVGRLFSTCGSVCVTASRLYEMEKSSRRTLLGYRITDIERQIAAFKGYYTSFGTVLGLVPFFHNRDYRRYPQVTVDDIPAVWEEIRPIQQMPDWGAGEIKDLYFNATDLAYKMYDMIFLGLEGIALHLQSMYNDRQMLEANPEMRMKRWQRMTDDYREGGWRVDEPAFQKRLDDHVRQYGSDRASLTSLLNQLDNEATNQLDPSLVSALNRVYLNQKGHVTYIFEHRDSLTQAQVNSHLRFIHCRQLLEQEMALCDLRLPAVGAYADLFTCRAAQEMAELLAPAIAKHVDFEHGYQYGAWVRAMMDLGVIRGRADRRNGSAVTRFVNKTFHEQIDKTTLFRYLNKEDEFEKIKDRYEAILSVVHREMAHVPRFNFLKRALR